MSHSRRTQSFAYPKALRETHFRFLLTRYIVFSNHLTQTSENEVYTDVPWRHNYRANRNCGRRSFWWSPINWSRSMSVKIKSAIRKCWISFAMPGIFTLLRNTVDWSFMISTFISTSHNLWKSMARLKPPPSLEGWKVRDFRERELVEAKVRTSTWPQFALIHDQRAIC